MQTQQISSSFYVVRFFALLSIVMAHSSFSQIPNELVLRILNAFARCGVVIFFIVSGYYFDKQRYNNVAQMINSKITTIVCPWFIWGTISYFVRFTKNPFYFNPTEFINWVLGCGTYLCYLTVLIILLCVFQILSYDTKVLLGLLFITFISIILTASNVGPFKAQRLDETALIFTYLDAYLNVLNWVGFFALGILLKKHNILNKINENLSKGKELLSLLFVPILFYLVTTEQYPSLYWTYYSIFIELILFLLIFVFSIKLNHIKVIRKIGESTLPIYLLHNLIHGPIFNKILPKSIVMGVLRPIVTVLIIYGLIRIGLCVSKKIHIEKAYKLILGLKVN